MNLPGPFNYDPAFDTASTCGAIKDNGNWVVTFNGCEYQGVHVMLTGFSLNPTGPEHNNERTIFFRISDIPDDETAFTITKSAGGPNGVEMTFRGGEINGATDQLRQFQMTIVTVGVREYDNGVYPDQSYLRDTFKFNATHAG